MLPLLNLPIGPSAVTYDPRQGGEGVQAYFADMLLDSDRNAKYYEAIYKTVQRFKHEQGREPVVLDAGCGTGFLTACALVAGANTVIAVDVDKSHIDNLPQRLGDDYMSRVVPVHINDASQGEVREFDMLISELLGTFSNSESAFKYLGQYAKHMKRHDNDAVYTVPHRVIQTVRKFKPVEHVKYEIDRKFEREYMPTELVGWLYELADPTYTDDPVIVRDDDFSVYPFECTLPRQELPPGYYVAEWTAELCTGVQLSNSWEWAHSQTTDQHSKHARARAWGLMCFSVLGTTKAIVNQRTDVHSTTPMIYQNGIRYEIEPKDDCRDDLRLANPTAEDVNANHKATRVMNSALIKLEHENEHPRMKRGYISFNLAASGIIADPSSDTPFPDTTLLFRTTLGAVIVAFTSIGLSKQWVNTLDYAGALPLLFREVQNHELDIPIQWVAPLKVKTKPHQWLTVGCAVQFQ